MRIFFDTEFIEDGNPTLSKHRGVEHNALDDALWLRRVFDEHRK